MNKNVFNRTNLQYIVDYDYERSCCTCNEDICRCTTINYTHVDNVDVSTVVKTLYDKYRKTTSDIDSYCFDRICHAHEIYNVELYEVETCYGYYGEEIDGVYFFNEEKIFNAYNEMLELATDIDKILYCLKLEYGYLIDCVKNATSANIIEVSTKNINLPQKDYFVRVSKQVVEDYKNRDLPIAVCMKRDNGYSLVDGYHRYVANLDSDLVSIVVLE